MYLGCILNQIFMAEYGDVNGMFGDKRRICWTLPDHEFICRAIAMLKIDSVYREFYIYDACIKSNFCHIIYSQEVLESNV